MVSSAMVFYENCLPRWYAGLARWLKIPSRHNFMSRPIKKNKRVLIFGVFDGLHPGHKFFLRQTREYGDELIVVAARDKTVWNLKRKKPFSAERERLKHLEGAKEVSRAVLGDLKLGNYLAVKKFRPRVICFGYDQNKLRLDLQKWLKRNKITEVKLVRIKPYKPGKYHSTLLRK